MKKQRNTSFAVRMETLNIHDYMFYLPQEKIALFPLPQRDQSKLLVYDQGVIKHQSFFNLPDLLPERAFLIFNNTKVIPARLIFRKETGAAIEVFLLNPLRPSPLLLEVMQATEVCVWHCTIGNAKRWSAGKALVNKLPDDSKIEARLMDKEKGTVEFRWSSGKSFAEVLTMTGETPLPPYLKRKAEASDRERYQTIYSKHEGAVAAPTAGLHFTEGVFKQLAAKGIAHDYVTLHVSAGTFQPVKSDNAHEHVMHQEQIIVSRGNLNNLLEPSRTIIAVGTTSMRTLESLYWFGVKLELDDNQHCYISQDDPYTLPQNISVEKSIQNILRYMDAHKLEQLIGETSMYIKPGYGFRICEGIITNFHQPGSTLILLIAAFVGNDWRNIYEEALENGYRFLSYGDSSLLIPKKKP